LRHHIHKNNGVVILMDFVAWNLAAQDFREDVVWIVGHRRRPLQLKIPFPGGN
jgi:hypothetical protein